MSLHYRAVAVACTLSCLELYNRARRPKGPVAREFVFHPVEVSIAQILSMPLFPAEIEEMPHPLWCGWRVMPPLAPDSQIAEAITGQARRIPMRDWLAQLARRLGMELGDAADEVRGAVERCVRGNRARWLAGWPECEVQGEFAR